MDMVAPHAGAWIETPVKIYDVEFGYVAPHAGAWIETANHAVQPVPVLSLPTRERGLKHLKVIYLLVDC